MCILRLSDYSGTYNLCSVCICVYWGYLIIQVHIIESGGKLMLSVCMCVYTEAIWPQVVLLIDPLLMRELAWGLEATIIAPPPPPHPVCQHPQDLSHYSTIFLLSPCTHTILQDIQCTIPRICQPPSSQVILLRIKSINCSVVDPDPKLICWIRLLVWQKIIIKKSQTLVKEDFFFVYKSLRFVLSFNNWRGKKVF